MKLAKDHILLISLASSVIGLALIYIATIQIEPKSILISDITADMEGRKILVEGHLAEKRKHEDGHLFLTVSDNNSKIQVPLFSDFMKELAQIGITENDFHVGDKIAVKGIVENYKGSLQIIPKNLNDVKILGE
ncbi:MAG: OB-fold nucleic acid binding domain-containing protein [Candidatus Aenigmarchaeota archaeon]|nr:OB-fold nucleic acid binding domain-containing protein [Candidatus Aenigmarchaeota archaeon]